MMTSKRSFFSSALIAAVAVVPLFFLGCAEQPQPAEQPAKEAAKPPEKPAEAPQAQPEKKPEEAKPAAAETAARKSLRNPSALKEKAPDVYKVKFETSKGDILIEVNRSWAPRGADRFYNLVKNGFYDECRFFRVVPNFVIQFGMHGDPAISRMWANARIKDDPVTKTNRRGTLSFATSGPNSRTTQVFINLKTNSFLDSQGFAPFGRIIEGMDVVGKLYAGYGEAPEQPLIRNQGNAYLNKRFPKLDYIKTATIVE